MLKKNKIIIISLIIIMSSISIYAGHFLFSRKSTQYPESKEPGIKEEAKSTPRNPPIVFSRLSMKLNGNTQEVRVLEVDIGSGGAEIKPVLSRDSIFGFEKLSSIVARSNAYAAVNGGFFHEFGQPGGMVAIDGQLLTLPTGKFPVLYIKDGEARLQKMNISFSLKVNQKEIKIDSINTLAQAGQTILYTPEYGKDTRIKKKNLSVIIKDNIVYDISEYPGKCDIPDNGKVLSFIEPTSYKKDTLPFKKGDVVEFKPIPEVAGMYQAYECGSWVVKDGRVIVADKDIWVGLLTNPDPRTAVGIRSDGKVLLVTVDGRQPGYSTGVSGKELGEILLRLGVKDAAMLDGGSSTEMIVKGEVVNKPSYRGEERLLGGALVVKIK